VADGGAEGAGVVGAGSRESCSDGTGARLADGAAAVGAGAVAGGGAEGAAAVGAGGGAGCFDGVAAGLVDGTAAVDADGGVCVVKDGAVGSADMSVPGGADRTGTSDCCPSLKGEPSRLATSSRPTDRTTTDRMTQLALILTA
jgi:hypothetical protein